MDHFGPTFCVVALCAAVSRCRFALTAVALGASGVVWAADGPPAICPEEPEFFATVADVSEDLAITLVDGRALRLAGTEAPRATAAAPSRPQELREILRSRLRDTTIGVTLLGAADRWRTVPAIVFTDDGVLNLTLLADGRLRMQPDGAAMACREALLHAEATARRLSLGVWRDPSLLAVDADAIEPYGAPPAANLDGLALVEGKVVSVGESVGRVYLNLGHRRGGFAISLPKRDIALMTSDAVKRARSVGTRIRVRGLIDRHTGLRVDVSDAYAIEILDSDAEHAAPPTP